LSCFRPLLIKHLLGKKRKLAQAQNQTTVTKLSLSKFVKPSV
jgi:hypothetical protein